MPKKEVIYQGLADLDVIIEDESESSPDYFRVTKLSSEFTAGVNIFKFKGNPSLFDENTPVYIEILDSNEEPIYYETDVDRQSAEQSAIVSVYINEDTAPGPGIVILCSTLSKDVDGFPLDKSEINLRWSKEIYIDQSLRSTDEIIFSDLPEVTIAGGDDAGVYTYLGYEDENRFYTASISNLEYYYVNDTPVLVTASLTTEGFGNTWEGADVRISYTDLANFSTPAGVVDQTSGYTSSIVSFQGDGIAFLNAPIQFDIINSTSKFQPTFASVLNARFLVEQSASLPPQETENSYNLVTATFTNLNPQVGQVARIRTYYRSAGVGQYVFANETDITDQADEFGFTDNSVSVVFPVDTVQRNDRLDFKFEFINPIGIVARQVVESLDNLFLGGNTYIGGDDNLITGSLFVAGETGTGVHISGKAGGAMIRSIGYRGFQNAIAGQITEDPETYGYPGFVLYSGSVGSLLNTGENYSGVGLELFASTSSYFKYTTADGGLLDIRTDRFYIGNDNLYLSGSNNNLEILVQEPGPPVLTKFRLDSTGAVTASAFYSFTGSSDNSADRYVMMDTRIGLIDGKNLGRVVFQQASSSIRELLMPLAPLTGSGYYTEANSPSGRARYSAEYLASGSSQIPDTLWTSIPGCSGIPLYILPYESTVIIFGDAVVQKTNSTATDMNIGLYLRFKLSLPATSSYATFGVSLTASIAAVSGTLTPFYPNDLTTGSYTDETYWTLYTTDANGGASTRAREIWTPFKAVISLPEEIANKLVILNCEYVFVRAWAYPRTPTRLAPVYGNATVRAKAKFANINAIVGRRLVASVTSGRGDYSGPPAPPEPGDVF